MGRVKVERCKKINGVEGSYFAHFPNVTDYYMSQIRPTRKEGAIEIYRFVMLHNIIETGRWKEYMIDTEVTEVKMGSKKFIAIMRKFEKDFWVWNKKQQEKNK